MIPAFSAKSYDFAEFIPARNYIAGEWCDPITSKRTQDVENPRHGKPMSRVKMGGADDVDVQRDDQDAPTGASHTTWSTALIAIPPMPITLAHTAP